MSGRSAADAAQTPIVCDYLDLMSLSYWFVNYDKRQFFQCGVFGWDDRYSMIGKGPGARALALLLSEYWRADRIGVENDSSRESDDILTIYLRIDVEIELMLLEVDGPHWIDEEVKKKTSTAFRRLCEFALFLKHEKATKILDATYGKGAWKTHYDQTLRRGGHQMSTHQGVIDAGNRLLKVYPGAWK